MTLLKKIRPFLSVFFWLWLFFILILMIIPTNGVTLYDFPGRDKLIHFGLFTFLGFFFVAARSKQKGLFQFTRKNLSTYLLILFSLSIELLHTLIKYRSFEILDSLTNGFGTLCGIIIGSIILSGILKE